MEEDKAVVNAEKETIEGVPIKSLADLNTESPKPGIYKGIPFNTYVDIDALNSSKIRKACESMLVYKRYLIEQEKGIAPSYPLEFGRAFGKLCEDPQAFETLIRTGPTKTPFTIAWNEEMEANPELIYVKEIDIDMLKAMMLAFRSHPYTKRFSYDAYNELTVIWICEHTGRLCKGLIDIYKDGNVIDIKTAAEVRPHKIKWQIIDLKYDIQVTFYMDGLRAHGFNCNGPADFFVEKKLLLPDVVPKIFNEEQTDECRERYVKAIKDITEAEKTGVYNGYAPEPLMDLYGFDEPSQTFE